MEERKIKIGKVAVRFMGEWNATEQYYKIDIATDAAGNWYCSKTGTDTAPSVNKPLPAIVDGKAENTDWKMVLYVSGVLSRLETAITSCTEATSMCQQKTTQCANATDTATRAAGSANLATTAALKAMDDSKLAAQNANAAAATALQTSELAKQLMAEMQQLAEELTAKAVGIPTIMHVDCIEDWSTANAVAQKIQTEILPAYLPHNVIFQIAEGTSVRVDPDGNLTKTGNTGVTKINVIPTDNTKLWQQVTISVRKPTMRITADGKIRLAAASTMSVC